MTAEEIVQRCHRAGVSFVDVDDLTYSEEIGWSLDGMPWQEWVEAMYEVRIP